MFRPVDRAWPDSRPQALRQYRAVGTEYIPGILGPNRVSDRDLPPTIRALQCGRQITPKKLASHTKNYRNESGRVQWPGKVR
jgi:hypothetical protein